MTDFNDPEQRLDYLLHHGVDAYNKAMEDHFAKTVVETVNGFNIRLVHSMRFGALWIVAPTTMGEPWRSLYAASTTPWLPTSSSSARSMR